MVAIFLSWAEDTPWIVFLRELFPVPLMLASVVRDTLSITDTNDEDQFIDFLSAGALVGFLEASGSAKRFSRKMMRLEIDTLDRLVPKIMEFAAAAKSSHCDKIAAKLPNGYVTMLSQTSVSLSQGEQQLIAIGRAFLSYPRILILDEATSSIDTRTEAIVQRGMDALMKGRTTLIIAHRLSTLRNATRLVVLDKGRIAEIGTHDELIEKHGIYYNLVMAQREMSKMA